MTKPIILALEPDAAQARQLEGVAVRVDADLRVTTSAEGALDVLAREVPDLILVPALLSRRDDLALAARLRELGASASHTQTLTMPILEVSEPAGARMIAFRRERRGGGCQAETFAGQVRVYLARAAELKGPSREPAALQTAGDPEVTVVAPQAPTQSQAGDWRHFDPTQDRFVELLAKLDAIASA